jgi:methyl coenzyme M reductase gamma subunit
MEDNIDDNFDWHLYLAELENRARQIIEDIYIEDNNLQTLPINPTLRNPAMINVYRPISESTIRTRVVYDIRDNNLHPVVNSPWVVNHISPATIDVPGPTSLPTSTDNNFPRYFSD